MKLQKYYFCVVILLFIENVTQGHGNNIQERPQDSAWYFYPFSIDLSAGLHVPSGKLASFYNPTLQFSGYMGIMVTKKLRAHIGLQFRGMDQTKPILLKANDSIIPYQSNKLQGGFGAWFSYTLYQNKQICTELIAGVANQSISTNIENRSNRDSIEIRGIGLSIGAHTWFHTYKGLNFGIRAEFNYANYDKSNFLVNNLGTNFFTVALIYRVQPRENAYKKWY
jgi:hypothetical protein